MTGDDTSVRRIFGRHECRKLAAFVKDKDALPATQHYSFRCPIFIRQTRANKLCLRGFGVLLEHAKRMQLYTVKVVTTEWGDVVVWFGLW